MGLVSTTILLVAGGAFLGVLLTPLHWNALGDGAFGGVGDKSGANIDMNPQTYLRAAPLGRPLNTPRASRPLRKQHGPQLGEHGRRAELRADGGRRPERERAAPRLAECRATLAAIAASRIGGPSAALAS